MTELSPGSHVSLLRRRVRDLVRRPAVTCAPDLPVRAAAALMDAHGVGSVVVLGDGGGPAGIVTVRDLRTRVVAAGLSGDTPSRAVMSAPLVAVAAGSPAFDALLLMTRRDIHHLGVVEAGRLAGVLGRDDFAAFWLADPVTLAREIERAESIDALATATPGLTDVVRRLVEDGAGPAEAGAVVAELNDRLVQRVTALAEARLDAEGHGRPPVPWSLLAAGSEGRREQTLRTDQDSGLVYADPPPDLAAHAAGYFARLASAVGGDLARLGFPKCDGGFMAENPRWCQPAAVWRRYVLGWLTEPEPQALLAASVYFDMRPVAGDEEPGRALAGWACAEAAGRPLFQRRLAQSAVERRPPLGLFGGLSVKWTGPYRGTIDLKARGVFPMTQAMRVYALAFGLTETNTFERLAGATARGAFTPAEASDFRAAYTVVLRIRLAHQLAAVEAGRPPDNRIVPRTLDRMERVTLAEAFRTLRWLQRHLAERFQTALLV